ncbi:hypothetical protein HPP92_019688 [Vanilla planifolia]|uniref:PPC domain-containing protein n=1 Tax=Vanilla planifolia TaxID=51239 RepID=A0A835Q4J5_VANPL|nr:hypothetical protein HPP92_020110 [Vanilla planifolia]KAG0465524.1 hypothetical protein HPP92_019688 [Vanilla planifolia]
MEQQEQEGSSNAEPTVKGTPASTAASSNGQSHTITSKYLAKRRVGRPPGSKNRNAIPSGGKPAPSFFLPHVVVPAGGDIVENIRFFASHNREMTFAVLSTGGFVSNAHILQRYALPPVLVELKGLFNILSISANFHPLRCEGDTIVSATLVGTKGQIIFGEVVGPFVAAEDLVVVLAPLSLPRR